MGMAIKSKCNLCNGGQFKLLKNALRDDKQVCKVFRCLKCGHIQLLPRPGAKDDREFYNKNLQDKERKKVIRYGILKANNSFDTQRHAQLIQRLCSDKKARIVDIGAGYGFFVDELFRSGYKNVLGIEISSQRRKLGQRHTKAKIMDFDLNSPSRDIGKFDLATLFHVLEHMAEPIKFLENCRKLVKKNGSLVCEVPNVNELLLKTCREYNDFYWIRAHLNYFSAKSLQECFKLAGFKKVRIQFAQRYGLINLCHWLNFRKPQIDKPVFEIDKPYKKIEELYRGFLTSRGESDAIIAWARV
jgi:2-polyprenyl-3-methyl-5-hydroxy-6-metoxy-1,4-benzoquinol methylase